MTTGLAPSGLGNGTAYASIPSPQWSGFTIPLPWGHLEIHAYALCILLGIVVALWLTQVRWSKRGAPAGSLWDIAIWAIPFGIIGGRLYHVFTSPDAYFGPNYSGGGDLWLIPQVWRGGLGIWGAVALGLVGAWIGCRKAGVKLPALMDAAAPGILLAQGIGRWGNYFNQELFGAPTTLPWGLQIDPRNPNFPPGMAADTLFHPTFLYESIWDIVFAVVLILLDRRFRFRRGMLFWLYAMVYTLGRVWIEALRIDDAQHFEILGMSLRLNVVTSVVVFVFALIVFVILALVARRGSANSVYLSGREPQLDSELEGGSVAQLNDATETTPEAADRESSADSTQGSDKAKTRRKKTPKRASAVGASEQTIESAPKSSTASSESEGASAERGQSTGVDTERAGAHEHKPVGSAAVSAEAEEAENASAAGNFLLPGSESADSQNVDTASHNVESEPVGGSVAATHSEGPEDTTSKGTPKNG